MTPIQLRQIAPFTATPLASTTFAATPGTPDYDVQSLDYLVVIDASAVNAGARLPNAATVAGRTFLIVKGDNAGTILTVSCIVNGQTINGSATYVVAGQGGSATVTSDGSNYWRT